LSNSNALKKQILALLGNQHVRMTPLDLERKFGGLRPRSFRKTLRSVIKEMVTEGSLLYTNHFNTTHLELNFNRPIQVSDRLIISPYGCSNLIPNPKGLLIKIDPGCAFGFGDHPTTRLSLRGVDMVMSDALRKGCCDTIQALDIGTGSGVLAVAAVALGAAGAVGIDIDPTALHEAAKNIHLNGMDHSILLTTDSPDSMAESRFALVMANLRPPTLKQMLPAIVKLSTAEAFWVFSGCRDDALESVIAMLPSNNTKIVWKERSCRWAALVAKYQRTSMI
jgi:ribosomal protein L11 methyltransferase